MTNDYFFDTDCLSAFLWINDTNILKELYGGRIIIPAPVYDELSNPCVPQLKRRTDVLLDENVVSVKQLETNTVEYELYNNLVHGDIDGKQIGKGEAAGIALAKVHNGILASNNYRDIAPYIERYGLKHIDTGGILVEALEKGLITEEDGNRIWANMIARNRLLPAPTFSEYLSNR